MRILDTTTFYRYLFVVLLSPTALKEKLNTLELLLGRFLKSVETAAAPAAKTIIEKIEF